MLNIAEKLNPLRSLHQQCRRHPTDETNRGQTEMRWQ